MALADIAARQDISLSYLEQLFAKLRRGGLVASVRGPGGGYRLSRTADELRIADIIMAVDEPIAATRCKTGSTKGCTKSGARCVTHDLWEELGQQIHVFLSSVSLADVVERRVLGRAKPCNEMACNDMESAEVRGRRIVMHYLDHNATSPLRPESLSAISHALSVGGNPSSVHAAGRAARAIVEEAREKVAALVRREIRPGDLHQRRHRGRLRWPWAARLTARSTRRTPRPARASPACLSPRLSTPP